MKRPKIMEQKIFGEYVATPIRNAFNDKTAYWLSKKDCMISIYMFTVEECLNVADLKQRLSLSGIKEYAAILEARFMSAPGDYKKAMETVTRFITAGTEHPATTKDAIEPSSKII